MPTEQFLRVLTENPGEVPATFLFYRGDYQQPRHEIAPGDLTVCVAEGQKGDIAKRDANLPTTGRRLAYARRLMSGRHPLVGRVLANRVWLHHFGRGIVGTPSDFGHLGERPTQSRIARLAGRRVRLERLGSEAAAAADRHVDRLSPKLGPHARTRRGRSRQSTPVADERPPARCRVDSRLRPGGQRLGFERMFGPPVPVREDAVGQIVVGVDTKVGANEPGADVPIGSEAYRRSVYIEVRRSRPLALTAGFRRAGDGDELRSPHRVDRRSAGPDDDEQRVHSLAGEPFRRTFGARRRARSAAASRAGFRVRLRPGPRRDRDG